MFEPVLRRSLVSLSKFQFSSLQLRQACV